jgi:hypothetical protein
MRKNGYYRRFQTSHELKQPQRWKNRIISYIVYVWNNRLWHEFHTKFHKKPQRNYAVIKCAQINVTGNEKLLWFRLVVLVMRKGRRPLITASSKLHLTISCNRHFGISECLIWNNIWHNVHTKFY